MLGKIKSVEDRYTAQNEVYKYVVLYGSMAERIMNNLSYKWDLLVEGAEIELVKQKNDKGYWDVIDIKRADEREKNIGEQVAIQCIVDLWDKDIPQELKDKALAWIEKKLR